MAYTALNLSVLSYANGFTLWHYTSTDTNTTITASNYFNGATDLLRKGDIILANTDTGGTFTTKIYFVTGNTGGVVSITAGV